VVNTSLVIIQGRLFLLNFNSLLTEFASSYEPLTVFTVKDLIIRILVKRILPIVIVVGRNAYIEEVPRTHRNSNLELGVSIPASASAASAPALPISSPAAEPFS
jgi:hypothetical protein